MRHEIYFQIFANKIIYSTFTNCQQHCFCPLANSSPNNIKTSIIYFLGHLVILRTFSGRWDIMHLLNNKKVTHPCHMKLFEHLLLKKIKKYDKCIHIILLNMRSTKKKRNMKHNCVEPKENIMNVKKKKKIKLRLE